MNQSVLVCPNCKLPLVTKTNQMVCKNGHTFDIAKEGYVNLLIGRKPGCDRGDNAMMTQARNRFLSAGYYKPLADALSEVETHYCNNGSNVLDICCGEGWYSARMAELNPNMNHYGFDISRDMVRIAAKRKCGQFFVGNISSVPVADGSIHFGMHLFAPFNEPEFARLLHHDGILVSVIPGKRHLMGLKSLLYDSPYANDEKEPILKTMRVIDRIRVDYSICLESNQAIRDLFLMTPYAFHTPEKSIAKLKNQEQLETQCSFIMLLMKGC